MKVYLLIHIVYFVFLEIILQQTPGQYTLTSACPNRVIRNREEGTNHCYEVIQQKVDWDTAEAMCVQREGRLAIIESFAISSEVQRIVQAMNGTENYWIGLRRVGNSTQFVWTDGKNLANERWNSNNPMQGIDCVAVSGGKQWFSLECASSNYFVCETDVCSNWTLRDGICYKKFEETKNWTEAASQCEGESAYLAEIPNIFVNNVVSGLIGGDECWIGLSTNNSDYSWRVGNFPLTDPTTYVPLNINDTNKCGTIGEGKEKTWGLEECSTKLNCAVCMRGSLSTETETEEPLSYCRTRTDNTIIQNGNCYRRDERAAVSLPIPAITCESFDGSLYKFNEITLNIHLIDNFNNFKSGEFYIQDPNQYDSFVPQNGYLNLLTVGINLTSKSRCKTLYSNGTLQDSVCEISINLYNYMCKSDYTPYVNESTYLLTDEWCYWSVAGNRDWTEADSNCGKEGGYLVEILDESVQDLILSLITNEDEYFDEYYWIGIVFVDSSPKWRSGANITFSNFSSISIEDIIPSKCVVIDKYGTWNVFYCNKTFSYICGKSVTDGDSSPCSPASTTAYSSTVSPTNPTSLPQNTTNIISVTSSPTQPAIDIINGTTDYVMECSRLNEVLEDTCTYFFETIVTNQNNNISGVDLLLMRQDNLNKLLLNVSEISTAVPLQLIYSTELVLVITRVRGDNTTQIPAGRNGITLGSDSFKANTTLAILVTAFTKENLNYSIISDQITIVATNNLTGQLKIAFQIHNTIYDNQTVQCVFLTSDGNWSVEGIITEVGCNKNVECTTDHLTTFAVLVSPYRIGDRNKALEVSLDVTSYLLLSISVLFLLSSLVIFFISGKQFFSVDVNILHFNYTLVLFLALICFIFGVELATSVSRVCIAIAFLLHFLWTNVFMSSLSIAILVFYSIWVVGIKHTARNLSQYLIPISWCVSLVWAAIWLIYGIVKNEYLDSDVEDDPCDTNDISDKSICFLNTQKQLVWTFLVPLFVILLINSTLLILSLYRIRLALKRQDASEGELRRLRKVAIGGVSLVPALGLFFIFSLPLAFSELYKDIAPLYTVFELIYVIFTAPLGVIHFFLITCRLTESKISMLGTAKNSSRFYNPSNDTVSTQTIERLKLNITRSNVKDDMSLSGLVENV